MKPQGFSHTLLGTREMNQDSWLVNDTKCLYAVADGIGGGLHGEVASEMAVRGFEEMAPPEGELTPTIKDLQQRVFTESTNRFGDAVMGTTFTGLRISQDQATLCHVGDSRCYLYTPNSLKQLTEDHESYDLSTDGPVLASYLGIPEELYPFKIQESTWTLVPNSIFLLCTDGLYRQLSHQRMTEILSTGKLEEIPWMLCVEAERDPYSDNVTVVIVKIT